MIIKQAELETVCGVTSKFPEFEQKEIAFAGRSNVGKSSLINGILNRKNLARTSATPGKTVTINFYNINQGAFHLVDLPGYGFAKASPQERAAWGRMIEKYLKTREQLMCIFLLIDMRHAPTKDDVMMYNWMKESGLRTAIIMTKQDKLKRSQYAKNTKVIKETLGLTPEVPLIPFSAVTRSGRDEILTLIDTILED